MDLLGKLASILAAGSMILSGALDEAAPQHDADGLLFLVNRQYRISDAFTPDDLTEAQVPGQVREMRAEAAAALEEMYAACLEETGCQLISVSGFRSYSKHSEHHLGLAMDIGQQSKPTLNEKFAETEGGIWARENCWRFGFILRYGEEWEDITGYKYEPWHFRYVGKDLAKEIHDAGVPFETWLTEYRVRVLQELLKEEETP